MSRPHAMEGSAEEDLGAPDSWEMADLDESMSRLRVSSKNSPTLDLPDELPQTKASAASGYSSSEPAERDVGLSEDVIGQVDQFLREALEKPRERLSVLRMEQDVEKFICDPTKQQLEFQALPTSYLRLAAHRVAQHYNLQSIALPDDNLPDGSGSRIMLCKTSECHFPPIRLADIPVCLPHDNNNGAVKVAIKQRPQKRSQFMNSANAHSSKTNHPKTVEERKEEYNKARARIFRCNNSASTGGKSECEPTLPDDFQYCSLTARPEEKFAVDGSEISLSRGLFDSSAGSSTIGRDRIEKEPVHNRYKTSNRVAIFRDREVDRKDPDYDRNYERYMQRFDPGFGFSGGPYTLQPMYSPALNYNTEFPQLGPGHRPHISYGHQHQPIPQHMQGPWAATSAPTSLRYGPPEGMMAPFNPSHMGTHSTSSIYLHSSQYGAPPRTGTAFVHPHEHVQPSAQIQRQSETNFGLARPR